MLKDYRNWLVSELKTLGNASHHAYAFGQANMAQRAIANLDEELAANLFVPLGRADARKVLTALEAVGQQGTSLPPELETLRDAIKASLVETNENDAL